MNGPICHGAIPLSQELTAIAATTPVPGMGCLQANCYLLESAEPVLFDTGLPALADATLSSLRDTLELASLRWIWITHADPDHVGALEQLLTAAPNSRVVTNYLGMGKLGMRLAIAPERFHLLNPGQTLPVGDRSLRAIALPSFDAPETMGAFDATSSTLFTSDCFGALLDEAALDSPPSCASRIDAAALRQGMATWTSVDAPWLAAVPTERFRESVTRLARLDARNVASTHLPFARDMVDELAAALCQAQHAPPFVGPDQAVLSAMLAA